MAKDIPDFVKLERHLINRTRNKPLRMMRFERVCKEYDSGLAIRVLEVEQFVGVSVHTLRNYAKELGYHLSVGTDVTGEMYLLIDKLNGKGEEA